MAASQSIGTLEEVKSWLATVTPGNEVSLGSAMFNAAMVQKVFQLLPGNDPIALKVDSVDASNATLSGTATILGESGTTAQFVFTQPANELLCTLTLTLPPSLEWALIPSLSVVFGDLVATLAPYEELSVVGMTFVATLKTTTSDALAMGVSLSVPTFDGDWMLTTTNVPIGTLTSAGLSALAGGVDVVGMLPKQFSEELAKLSLNAFEVVFNPSASTCSALRLNMAYNANWEFFDKKFIVESVTFDVEVLNVRPGPISYDAKLYAKLALPPLPAFEVGGQFPDPAMVFVRLAPTQVLKLTQVFAFLQIPAPGGMSDVEISVLTMSLYPDDAIFTFNLSITKPILIAAKASLDAFLFDMTVLHDPTAGFSGRGSLYAHFTVGQAQLMLSGSYSQQGGLNITGEGKNIPIGELITDLTGKFGIPGDKIPTPLNELVLTVLKANLNTGAQTFDFTCTGTTTISGVPVEFTPTVHLKYAKDAFEARFGGTLVLKQNMGGGVTRDLTFNVTFSTTATDTWIQATFVASGQAVEFQDLASIFGVTLPAIPDALNLGLEEIGFHYDFTKKALTFGLQSKNYGNAVLVRLPVEKPSLQIAAESAPAEDGPALKPFDPPSEGEMQSVFLLSTGQSFSLSNLPLVGQELAKIEDIRIDNLQAAISSQDSIEGNDITAINNQIGAFLSDKYPRVPDAGMKGRILLSASLHFGEDVLPLNVSLGGKASGSRGLAATTGMELEIARQGGVVRASDNDGGATWFNVQKSFGPITIQRIGVLYQSETQTLWFQLDASLAAGPLTLSLVGLGIGSPLSDFKPVFFLKGLGVAYSAPPLTIAGALINLAPPGADYIEFEGGVMISTASFTVQAFGYYGAKDGFTSMFIFGDLMYPFGGPPAFFVTGTALGFGYNSNLNIPYIEQVQVFPFVQVLSNPDFFGKNPTPADVLGKMLDKDPKVPDTPWVQRQNGSLWFAAGITFTSFELVNSVAMVFIQIGPELVIALIGVSTAQFPQKIKGVTNQPVYGYIALDLEVRFAPTAGVFSLAAQLASGSFLLDRSCVLTGGFAFYVWFGPNPHAGDFVVSLGGYHPGFKPPNYYPTVPRVGFHWAIDSSITISGGTYFAFTPAALMVGGALNATFQSGNLKAWFDAHADIIVRWKPFWFDASIGITIGASYTIDLLFTSATLSVELGVDLNLWGPPTGGRVEVNWYVISFSIPFGSSREDGQAIKGWDDGVQAMLPNTGTETAPNVLSLTPSAGLTPSGTAPGSDNTSRRSATQPPAPWLVRGSQFGFVVDAPIPATKLTVGESHTFNGKTFDVYPLRWTNVSATQEITIKGPDGSDYSGSFEATQTTKSVPQALWGQPPQTGSGKPQVPRGSDLLVPGQSTGVSLLVNPPTLGASPGSIALANISYVDLELKGAVTPLLASAEPEGDIAVVSDKTIAVITAPATGIASATVIANRIAMLDALKLLSYAPVTRNDPMERFAKKIGCSLTDQPLLVAAVPDKTEILQRSKA